jgi:hypothetical protein
MQFLEVSPIFAREDSGRGVAAVFEGWMNLIYWSWHRGNTETWPDDRWTAVVGGLGPFEPRLDGPMSRRAYEQLIAVEIEIRESGTTYSCPQGTMILAYHEPCWRGRHAIRIWAGGSTPLCPRAGRAGRVKMLVREPGHKHQHLPGLCRGEFSANGNSLTRFGAALNIF